MTQVYRAKRRVIEPYLVEIRNQIVHGLSNHMGLDGTQIAGVVGVDKATVSRILRREEHVSDLIHRVIKKVKVKETKKLRN